LRDQILYAESLDTALINHAKGFPLRPVSHSTSVKDGPTVRRTHDNSCHRCLQHCCSMSKMGTR